MRAYNILYWQGRAVIIGLPQAADARVTPNARMLLVRVVANLCRYFDRQGVPRDPCAIAGELWDRHRNATL
jgi:serine/threonine-protein kinase RIO1